MGMVSLVRAPVLDCAAVDPAPIVPLSVLDAVGLTVAGQRFLPSLVIFFFYSK